MLKEAAAAAASDAASPEGKMGQGDVSSGSSPEVLAIISPVRNKLTEIRRLMGVARDFITESNGLIEDVPEGQKMMKEEHATVRKCRVLNKFMTRALGGLDCIYQDRDGKRVVGLCGELTMFLIGYYFSKEVLDDDVFPEDPRSTIKKAREAALRRITYTDEKLGDLLRTYPVTEDDVAFTEVVTAVERVHTGLISLRHKMEDLMRVSDVAHDEATDIPCLAPHQGQTAELRTDVGHHRSLLDFYLCKQTGKVLTNWPGQSSNFVVQATVPDCGMRTNPTHGLRVTAAVWTDVGNLFYWTLALMLAGTSSLLPTSGAFRTTSKSKPTSTTTSPSSPPASSCRPLISFPPRHHRPLPAIPYSCHILYFTMYVLP